MKTLATLALVISTTLGFSDSVFQELTHGAVGVTNRGLDVNIQDQTTRPIDLYFSQALGAPTTLASPASTNDLTLSLTSSANFVDGAYIGILDAATGSFYFGTQVGAPVGNTVSIDTPIDFPFTAGSTVIPTTTNMVVDGSTTTQVFQIGPIGAQAGISVDITRINIYIQSEDGMDDALFGSLDPLNLGVVLRVKNGQYYNLWNVKTNGDLGLICFDTAYTEKVNDYYGFRARNTFAGQSKHGVAIRLGPGETLEILIQDDLTVGNKMEVFNVMAQGHVVEDPN